MKNSKKQTKKVAMAARPLIPPNPKPKPKESDMAKRKGSTKKARC